MYGGEDPAINMARHLQPQGIFHAHAHDMAYLEEWIGDILNLRRDNDRGGTGHSA